MMNHLRIPFRTRRRRHLLVVLAFALVVLSPGTASGSVTIESYGRAAATIDGPLAAVYDYTAGTAATWSTSADFDAGSHDGTTAATVPDALTLAPIGPAGVTIPDPATPWWNTAWSTRECFSVDHTGGSMSVTEYPVALSWSPNSLVAGDLVQADFGDVRAVAADGVTELPVWFEDAATTWVQIDEITAGTSTSFCLYYGYDAGTAPMPANRGPAAVFSYSVPKPVYYTVSAAYSGTETVAVASYVDGNTIEVDGAAGTATATLNDGERTTFGANTPATEYRVTGPIAARGVGDGLDTLVPISWAGTRFVVPSNREDGITSQVLSFYAPFAGGTITISAGTDPVPVATVAISASGTASWTETADEIAAGEAVIVESTVPVLAHHVTTNREDATALHPVRNVTWFGVSSTARIGADGEAAPGTATDVTITRSSSGTSTAQLFRGEELVLAGTPGGGGPDDGIAVAAGGSAAGRAIGALSQDDGDGRETVTFLPRRELSDRYLLVTDAEYAAVVCPGGSASLSVTDGAGATTSFSCTGGSVGHGLLTGGIDVSAARAIEVTSPGSIVYLMYEDGATNDETNVLGMKQGRQYVWPAPQISGPANPEGLLPAAATWESAAFDTGTGSEVFGAIDFAATVIEGVTEIEVRVATSNANPPTSFVGPGGTAVSSWSLADLPSVLDLAHDGHRYLRIKVDLTTTDRFGSTPRLDAITVDHHLPPVARDAGGRGVIAVAGSTASTTTYLLRVRTDSPTLAGSTAGVTRVSGTNLTNLTPGELRLVNTATGLDSLQWSTTGASGAPAPFSASAGHSVVLVHTTAGPGSSTIDFTWNLNVGGSASILVQSDLTVEIATP
jgi:hypothetical protein